MIDEAQIRAWRLERYSGMVSAVGEYTPSEFWDALDEIERLRNALGTIARNVDAGAVHVGWCGDYAKRILNGEKNENS